MPECDVSSRSEANVESVYKEDEEECDISDSVSDRGMVS